jgi:hypothetical protein
MPTKNCESGFGTHTREETMQARMRQMYLFAVVAVALIVVLGGTALAQSTNTHVGMWKANIAKSKVVSSTPIKSTATKIEAAGAGVKYTVDAAFADGTGGSPRTMTERITA